MIMLCMKITPLRKRERQMCALKLTCTKSTKHTKKQSDANRSQTDAQQVPNLAALLFYLYSRLQIVLRN